MKKVLYILSGYPSIYSYIDSSILSALENRNDTLLEVCSPLLPLAELKKKCYLFRPDLVLTVLGDFLDREKREWIVTQSFQSAVWLTEDPYYTDKSISTLPFFQYIFTINKASAAYYKTLGYKHVYFLSLGTNTNVFMPQTIVKTNDVCLIGYPYEERINLINFILDETPLRVLVVGNLWRKSLVKQLKKKKLTIIDRWVPPTKAGIIYQSANICLNTLRESTDPTNQNTAGIQNNSTNNRTFDITAASAFQLVQFTDDLANQFELETEISCFHSKIELLNKLEQYMVQDKLREEIAANGRRKVLDYHTFSHRIEKIFAIIFQ